MYVSFYLPCYFFLHLVILFCSSRSHPTTKTVWYGNMVSFLNRNNTLFIPIIGTRILLIFIYLFIFFLNVFLIYFSFNTTRKHLPWCKHVSKQKYYFCFEVHRLDMWYLKHLDIIILLFIIFTLILRLLIMCVFVLPLCLLGFVEDVTQ